VAEPSVVPEVVPGDWIRVEYAELLERTRDPERALQAVDPATPVVLRVAPAEQGHAWLAVFNFHEGVWAAVERLDPVDGGSARRAVFSRPFETPLLAGEHRLLAGDRPDRVRWQVRDGERERSWEMRRVEPSVEAWAGPVVLGGRYADATGRPFDFGDGGRLVWDGREYRYRVHLDMVGAECPYFEAESADGQSPAVTFGFRRDGEQLMLFDAGTADDPVIVCEGAPLHVLTPAP
jgi:hypothetical protein